MSYKELPSTKTTPDTSLWRKNHKLIFEIVFIKYEIKIHISESSKKILLIKRQS